MRVITLLSIYTLILTSCSSEVGVKSTSVNYENQPLFTVNDEPVSTEEFIYVYKKNNSNSDSAFTKEDIDEYLELYKKFKLKIAEAKAQGVDTTKAFIKEFNTYKEQLKKPYLTENKVTEELIQEAYKRYQIELNASHILINVDENASPVDTLQAYNKALDIRAKAIDGEKFTSLAKQYSDDPSASRNGGNLGYFTAFQMVYPFESAAYSTKEGAISMPVRTRFGYHLIKVLDKRGAQGSVSVSHLMLRIKPEKQDSLEKRNKIFELYDQAVGGANWEQLVEQFSEDINSKRKGGALPPFKVGQMPFAFQEAAFSIQNPGEFADPVMTPYGWHIIRLEKRTPIESFKEMENSLRARVKRDARGEKNKLALIQRLKKENNYVLHSELLSELYDLADSSLIKGEWNYEELALDVSDMLISFEKESIPVSQFLDYIVQNQRPNKADPKTYMQSLFNEFEEKAVIAYEENHLEDKYYDYKMLVKEYREGIMLFQLMEDEVWQKAVDDSVGLKEFYSKNQNKYKWDKRLKVFIYSADDEKIISEIQSLIDNGDSLAFSKKELEAKYNQLTALTLQVESGVYEPTEKSVLEKIQHTSGTHKVELEDRFVLVLVQEVLPPSTKPFDQVRGLVISDYQNQLEKEWVEELRGKFPIAVNNGQLKHAYKSLIK
ncbi:MAG: peptidylprolyl isomerase [Fulvivirga sp.]